MKKFAILIISAGIFLALSTQDAFAQQRKVTNCKRMKTEKVLIQKEKAVKPRKAEEDRRKAHPMRANTKKQQAIKSQRRANSKAVRRNVR